MTATRFSWDNCKNLQLGSPGNTISWSGKEADEPLSQASVRCRGRCLADVDIHQIPVIWVKAPACILTRHSCLGAAFTAPRLLSGEKFPPCFQPTQVTVFGWQTQGVEGITRNPNLFTSRQNRFRQSKINKSPGTICDWPESCQKYVISDQMRGKNEHTPLLQHTHTHRIALSEALSVTVMLPPLSGSSNSDGGL